MENECGCSELNKEETENIRTRKEINTGEDTQKLCLQQIQ